MKRLSFFVAVTLACTLLAGPGQQALLTVKPPAGGGAAWVDIQTTFNASDTGVVTTVMVWQDVTLPTGNATKLRAYVRGYNYAGELRLGLYSNAGTKLQEAVTATIGATGYVEVAITPQAVTSGTYKVAYISQDNNSVDIGYDNSTGTAYYDASQTGGNLPGTLPSGTGFTGKTGLGVYVE